MTVTFSFITSGLPAGPATYGGIHITRCSDQFWPKAWFLKWPETIHLCEYARFSVSVVPSSSWLGWIRLNRNTLPCIANMMK